MARKAVQKPVSHNTRIGFMTGPRTASSHARRRPSRLIHRLSGSTVTASQYSYASDDRSRHERAEARDASTQKDANLIFPFISGPQKRYGDCMTTVHELPAKRADGMVCWAVSLTGVRDGLAVSVSPGATTAPPVTEGSRCVRLSQSAQLPTGSTQNEVREGCVYRTRPDRDRSALTRSASPRSGQRSVASCCQPIKLLSNVTVLSWRPCSRLRHRVIAKHLERKSCASVSHIWATCAVIVVSGVIGKHGCWPNPSGMGRESVLVTVNSTVSLWPAR